MRGVHAHELTFEDLREEFRLPTGFPDEVEAAASAAVDRFAGERRDARDIPFVTIDPPGSRDLDQAVHVVEKDGGGWTLHYAIADVGAFVPLGSPIDLEARKRGQTVYVPDGSVPLHPLALSEGAASLLPDEDRPCALWTIECGPDGVISSGTVERAVIRSTARLDYATVQSWVDEGRELPEAITGLKSFGEARRALAVRRGAIELELPAQEIARGDDGRWAVRLEARTEADAWNAECSLATGHVAATIMMRGKAGILRTLRAATPESELEFRKAAAALGLSWPDGVAPGEFLAGLPRGDVRTLAINTAATRLLRGADYLAFDGEAPNDADAWHAGVGQVYAHATAPLRRLVDRFVIETCLAIEAGEEVAAELRACYDEVRQTMNDTNRSASAVEQAALDKGEAVVLQDRVGEAFRVAVTRAAKREGTKTRAAEVFLVEPPVFAKCEGDSPAGAVVSATLVEADPAKREVRFRAAEAAAP